VAKRKRRSKPRDPLRYRAGNRRERTERNRAICSRREQGVTFAQIGREFGLSRERTRRIVVTNEYKAERAKRRAPLRNTFAKGVMRLLRA